MDARPKLLIVDDDPRIVATLKPFLERAGFQVLGAVDGDDALRKVASFEPDLVILDILMPQLDGREVLRRLRQDHNLVHVIMLTQVTGLGDRVQALDEGADDYINKPFEPSELVARVRAVLRRARSDHSSLDAARKLISGPLLLDRQLRRAYLGKEELSLTAKEFGVLEYLMLRPGQAVNCDELLGAVWGQDYLVGPDNLYVRVAELRRALGDNAAKARLIETVSGQGYRFAGAVEVKP